MDTGGETATWRVACRRLAALALLIIGVASCGGESAPETEAASEPAANVETSPASPLEAALGFASEPSRRHYQLITRQGQADEAMVQCMEQAGFVYATASAGEALRSGPFVGDGTREWTELNGLGITLAFTDALAADADRGSQDANAVNSAFIASLSEAQAAAYDQALVGDLAASSTTDGYEPQGCWGRSFNEIVRSLTVLDEFESELERLNTRLLADPRVIAFQREWSACMDESGYRYSNETAMVDDIYARLLEIQLVGTDGVLRVTDAESLDMLIAYEKQAAVAGFDCRQGFAHDLDQLRYDYEEEFLDDNRFRIADLQALESTSRTGG